jgi:HK97 family phage major capsid protein
MPSHIQILDDVGKRKKGDVARVGVGSGEITESVMRMLVADGLAKEIDADEALRAAEDARFARLESSITETLRTALDGGKKTPKGPPHGSGALIDRIRGQSVPEEEQDTNRSFRDALRCIFLSQAKDAPQGVNEAARNRLRGYLNEVSEYTRDAEGNERLVTTRTLDNGNMEQVIRSGSDSLSGGQQYGMSLKPTYVNNLFEIAMESEVFAQYTQPVPVTSGNEVIWPMLNQYQAPQVINGIPMSASFGGVSIYRVGEETARTSSDAKIAQNKFHVPDIAGLTDFSRDYIMDSSDYIPMDSVVTRKFADAHAWVKDWEFIRADGVGKSQGYFNANATITGGPNSGARENANKISSDDLMWMISHLHGMCRSDARFIANITAYPQLGILRDLNGNAVFQPNALIDQAMLQSAIKEAKVERGGMRVMLGGVILGFPIYFTEKVPILGTTGDISLCCPWQYGDATKLAFEIGMSEHIYFLTDRIAYRTKGRFTGHSLWPEAFTQADNIATPASGTQTSPFIVLHS